MDKLLGPASSQHVDPDIDLDLLDYILSLTPAERLRRHQAALELVLALRKAGIRHYGFDPRSAQATD